MFFIVQASLLLNTHTHQIQKEIKYNPYSSSSLQCLYCCSPFSMYRTGCAESLSFLFLQFLRDLLDTLFCLLDDNTDKYGPLVFQSLVGHLQQDKCNVIILQLFIFTITYGGFCHLRSCVFQVFIINLLRDSRFYHFRPVMDSYIQNHFAGALAYKYRNVCYLLFNKSFIGTKLTTWF